MRAMRNYLQFFACVGEGHCPIVRLTHVLKTAKTVGQVDDHLARSTMPHTGTSLRGRFLISRDQARCIDGIGHLGRGYKVNFEFQDGKRSQAEGARKDLPGRAARSLSQTRRIKSAKLTHHYDPAW